MKKFILSSILLLAACASDAFLTTHGNMPPQSKIELIAPGDHKQTVVNILGTPSNISPLDSSSWIYMTSVSKKVAFLEPELISRDILIIKFDAQDKVVMITKKDEMSGKEVAISTEETTSQGAEQELNFFEKAFGTLSPNVAQ